jgi:hypothetical protein
MDRNSVRISHYSESDELSPRSRGCGSFPSEWTLMCLPLNPVTGDDDIPFQLLFNSLNFEHVSFLHVRTTHARTRVCVICVARVRLHTVWSRKIETVLDFVDRALLDYP